MAKGVAANHNQALRDINEGFGKSVQWASSRPFVAVSLFVLGLTSMGFALTALSMLSLIILPIMLLLLVGTVGYRRLTHNLVPNAELGDRAIQWWATATMATDITFDAQAVDLEGLPNQHHLRRVVQAYADGTIGARKFGEYYEKAFAGDTTPFGTRLEAATVAYAIYKGDLYNEADLNEISQGSPNVISAWSQPRTPGKNYTREHNCYTVRKVLEWYDNRALDTDPDGGLEW